MPADIYHLADHQAVICAECGSVAWNVLRSGLIKCVACGEQRELPAETVAAATRLSNDWQLVTHGR